MEFASAVMTRSIGACCTEIWSYGRAGGARRTLLGLSIYYQDVAL
jgi:hypothetical protein